MYLIHLSSKLSGTYHSALRASEAVANECHVEVIDSKTTSMAMGLLISRASQLINLGVNLKQVTAIIKQVTTNVHLLVLFDTLKYMVRGGRIGKVKSLLGSVLNVKPLLTITDGEFVPVNKVRSRSRGIEKLFDFAAAASDTAEMAIVHSTTQYEAESLAYRVSSETKHENIVVSRFGPAPGSTWRSRGISYWVFGEIKITENISIEGEALS